MIGRLKDLLAAPAGSAAFGRLVARAEAWDDANPARLRVLTYHRVDHPDARPDLNPRLISATPQGFAAQMEAIAKRFHVVPLAALLAALRGEAPLPPRPLLLTFDDAYVDFEAHAWPVMRRLGLPVTLFVPTAYPDRPERGFWWDRLHRAVSVSAQGPGHLETPLGPLDCRTPAARGGAYARLSRAVKARPHAEAMALVDAVCAAAALPAQALEPHAPAVLGWDALRRLAGEGVALAPHTRSHPLLHRLPAAEARAEIAGARADLERELGAAPPAFAYPDGGYTPETRAILAELGFEAAFSTRRGIADLRDPAPLEIPRINVGRRVTPALLRARLIAWPRRRHLPIAARPPAAPAVATLPPSGAAP